MTDEGWTYSRTSKYGNGDNANSRPELYICGVESGDDGEGCLGGNVVALAGTTSPTFDTPLTDRHMSYGQYRMLGVNYNSLAGFPTPMKLPPIFPLSDTELRNK